MPRRTVQEVTVQDVQKRRIPNKHYVYIIKVFWSDGSTEVIYRRYSKFFDLQMELLDKFPVEGGQKDPKRRIIPFLPGKILFRRSHIRDVAMKRLGPINEYCRALIQLPVYISQCEEVRVFFETRPEDLNPPKEEPITKKKTGDSSAADALFLDQYVAVTDYEKQESSEISLHVGQVVEVIEKNESGWWFVSSEDAQGWVPATCLEAQTQDDPDEFTFPGGEVPRRFWSLPRHVGRRRTLGDLFSTGFGQEENYSVIYPYSARDEDEIDLERGMIVEVIQKNLEGWWKIRSHGREGWAPASYLKKADIQSPKLSAGAAAHASTNDLDGASRHNMQNNAVKENRDNSHKENRLSFLSENKRVGSRHRPPPRRDLTIPRGTNLPKPPVPPQVEEEFYTIADFQTTIPDGISFQAGVKVEVIEKNSSGWWYIQIDDKEGWAPVTFIDKYKKTSNAIRPNFLAPLPNEMEKLKLDDGGSANASGTDDTWSKPLPDEPNTTSESCPRPKLRDWKAVSGRVGSGPLPPAPTAPPAEEKPALPPRRESINKSFELEIAEKHRPDHSKPLPPKPPAPGVIVPLVAPKAAPLKPDKPPEAKKEDKSKPLHLRNEMGLECGHKVSAKEVKKCNLKPVPKQPPKPKVDPPEEKPEVAGPAVFMKPKPVIRPKPVPAAKPDPPAENKLDITNLRSKLRPPKPADVNSDGSPAVNSPACSGTPILNNGKPSDDPKLPFKHINGLNQESPSPPTKPAVPSPKEPPQRPPIMVPKRPPPPRNPSSPTDFKPLKEALDAPKMAPPQLNRPPPPKPKGFLPTNKEKEEPKVGKVSVVPKPLAKSEKPCPPSDKLPPLLKEASRDELYLAVADFEGDDNTSGFKVGTLFEVLEKNGSGWWFCKNVREEVEGWIPSNYLSKKP
ncbi:SH3 and PX domain-containing protein 2B isoform X2 [Takifugu rubripes]|uniref:SH3 and PX domains 2B n=1 Tax=Takifugu rubripes TaxID=31033 RepID=H2RVN3_TAKRU|nr:SH3 and PX domain-containing protein 2B isoform X2 [Takifugu rubripes]